MVDDNRVVASRPRPHPGSQLARDRQSTLRGAHSLPRWTKHISFERSRSDDSGVGRPFPVRTGALLMLKFPRRHNIYRPKNPITLQLKRSIAIVILGSRSAKNQGSSITSNRLGSKHRGHLIVRTTVVVFSLISGHELRPDRSDRLVADIGIVVFRNSLMRARIPCAIHHITSHLPLHCLLSLRLHGAASEQRTADQNERRNGCPAHRGAKARERRTDRNKDGVHGGEPTTLHFSAIKRRKAPEDNASRALLFSPHSDQKQSSVQLAAPLRLHASPLVVAGPLSSHCPVARSTIQTSLRFPQSPLPQTM